MPLNEIIGNAVALVACVVEMISGYIKSKKGTMFWQTVSKGLNTASCLFLGAHTGTVSNVLTIGRNILAYKEKLTVWAKGIIVVLNIGLAVAFNKSGWLGLVPLLASVPYTILMDKLNAVQFKVLVIYTLVFWGIYNFVTHNYVSVLFGVGTLVTSCIAVYRLRRDRTTKDGDDYKEMG